MSLPYDEMKTPFQSKVSKAEQWARGETKNTSYSQSGCSITVPERALSELVTLRDNLTESNRQLREELERMREQLSAQTNTITVLCFAIDPDCKHGPETAKLADYAIKTRKLALDISNQSTRKS